MEPGKIDNHITLKPLEPLELTNIESKVIVRSARDQEDKNVIVIGLNNPPPITKEYVHYLGRYRYT